MPLIVYQQAFGLNQMGMAAAYAVAMMLVMLVFMLLYLYRRAERRRRMIAQPALDADPRSIWSTWALVLRHRPSR